MTKKIVTIGGGNGQSILLKGLSGCDLDVTAIVSMIDNGGSTGKIRENYNVLPSGDIRRCLIALAQDNLELQKAMAFRFTDGDLENHNFGNLLILALEKSLGSYENAIDYLHKTLKVKGQALPVTLAKTNLMAELEDGQIIKGETNIDVPAHDKNLRIKKVYLENKATANSKVLEAIKKADLIIYTIGDLYTSVIPNLLVTGIKEAISKSKAQKIYTINRTTKKGETHGFTIEDYVGEIKKYLSDNSLNSILIDENLEPAPEGYELVAYKEIKEVEIIKADLSTPEDRAHINGDKLAKAIYNLCQK